MVGFDIDIPGKGKTVSVIALAAIIAPVAVATSELGAGRCLMSAVYQVIRIPRSHQSLTCFSSRHLCCSSVEALSLRSGLEVRDDSRFH